MDEGSIVVPQQLFQVEDVDVNLASSPRESPGQQNQALQAYPAHHPQPLWPRPPGSPFEMHVVPKISEWEAVETLAVIEHSLLRAQRWQYLL